MKRSLMYLVAFAPAMVALPSVASAPAPGAPVIAVLAFDNNSIGKDAKDFDGIGKGVMDLLITDLASNPKVRVVDRDRVQQLLAEQNLTKSGAIDAESAVKVGKLLGACYSIYGGFMRDLTGGNALTAHTTSNETGQIENPEKVLSKGDDVMALIAQLSAKLSSDMKLAACGATRSASAAPAQQGGNMAVPVAKDAPTSGVPAAASAAPANDRYAKVLTPAELTKLHETKGLDARTMLLYSRALDAEDHKDKAKAVELLSQVVAKVAPSVFQPAADKLALLKTSGD
jgi:TolB-like protein